LRTHGGLGLLRGGAYRLDHPRGDVRIGELQDVAVTDLAGQGQRLRAVRGDPDLEPAVGHPREVQISPVALD